MTGSPSHPRRRAEDWRTDSEVRLNRRWFQDVAGALGYDPRQVESVRMNQTEVTVTIHEDGHMRSIRHRMAVTDE